MAVNVKIQIKRTLFRLICCVLTSIILQDKRPATFRCFIVMGTIFVCNLNQLVKKHITLGLFLNSYHEEHQWNSRKCEEIALGDICLLLATERSHRVSAKPFFAYHTHLLVRLTLIEKCTAMLTVKRRFYSLQHSTIMFGGQVAVYERWPHVLITKLFQPSHKCAIPAV